MNYLEMITHTLYNAFFVDLFVRASNALAISMYHNLGYIIYRQVLGYYSGDDSEDAYGNYVCFPLSRYRVVIHVA